MFSLKMEKRSQLGLLVILGLLAMMSILLLHVAIGMHVYAFLCWTGDCNLEMAIMIVDAVVSGGGWLAAFEFPIITPIVATITVWLMDGYWYAVSA